MFILISLYIIIALFLLAYAFRHRLDLLCIATVCFIVYSMYCAKGFGISGFYRPVLSHRLYYFIYLQMIIIFTTVYIYRKWFSNSRKHQLNYDYDQYSSSDIKIIDTTFYIYILIMLMFTAVNVFRIGFSGFSSGKENVWEQSNILYIISLYGAFPAFAYGIHNKRKFIYLGALLIEIAIFFAGSRAFLATLIIIFLCNKGTSFWDKNKGNIKVFIIGALAVVFLLIYRMIDQQIMNGEIIESFSLLKDPATWSEALEFNEPRVIIANYDYVLTSGIKLPFSDVVYRILDFIPGFTKLFSIEIKYPEYFSTWLMEEVHASAGVGGTIWGESYAMMGLGGIISSTIIWLIFLFICNKHLDFHNISSYFLVSIGTYLAWYINRLDFNRVAQSIKVMLFCYILWLIIYLFLGGELKLYKYKVIFYKKKINFFRGYYIAEY